MSSWKRSVAALLSAVMLLSSLPGAAFATVAEEADTPLQLEETAAAEQSDAAQATTDDEAAPVESATDDKAAPVESATDDEAAPVESATDDEAAPVESATDDEAAPVESATDDEAAPDEPATEDEAAPVEEDEDASLNSDAALASGEDDAVYEIGFRFSEDEPWRIVTEEKNSYYIPDPYTEYGGEVVGKFSENGGYSILVPYQENDDGEDVSFKDLRVYVMVLDVNGNSSAYKSGAQKYFTIKNEKSVINIDRGTGYKLSFYASWLEEFYYSGRADGSGAKTITSDEDYYNIYAQDYDDLLFLKNKTHTVELTRDEANPYVNPFPYTLTFYRDGDLKFTNASKGATVHEDDNSVTFDKSGEYVTVNGYKFTLKDTLKGEVTYSGVGNSLTQKTLGNDAEWAKDHEDAYEVPESKNYTLKLGEEDSFPFEVNFRLRGEVFSKDNFKNGKNVDTENVTVEGNVIFSKQDASVKVGDYTFTAHDDRIGEVKFETVVPEGAAAYGAENRPFRSVTLGADAEKAQENPVDLTRAEDGTWTETGYALVDGKTYTIQLKDGDTFPLQVKFSLPRDTETELKAKSLSGGAKAVDKAEGEPKNEVTVEFAKQDGSVTIGNYTFKVHSPFVGAVRYETTHSEADVNFTRWQIVGTDEDYAKAVKEAADEVHIAPEYVLFSNGAYTIELEEGEFFPRTVTFQKWDDAKGWTLTDEDGNPLARDEDGNPIPADDKELAKVWQKKTFDGVNSTTTNLFGHTFKVHAYWLEEVWYKFPGWDWVVVGTDKERAAQNAKGRASGWFDAYYELFDDAGNYAINPGDDVVFPCTVTFRLRNASGAYTDTEETFARSSSTVTLRNHVFSLRAAWKGEIVYSVDGYEYSKTVGHDAAWAATHADYDAVSEDGSYAIRVDDYDLTFPVDVTFHLRNSTAETTITFKTPDDVHEYEGVNFSVRPTWLDQVTYTIYKDFISEEYGQKTEYHEVTIGTEAAWAEVRAKAAAEVTEEELKNNPLLNIPDYQLPVFNENGAIEIKLPNSDAFYPYGMRFLYSRVKTSADGQRLERDDRAERIWFESPEDVKTVGGYKFQVTSERVDPNQLISAGLWVGVTFDENNNRVSGQYVPFVRDADGFDYWAARRAEAEYKAGLEEYEASLQSLLPLRENYLYANLGGFSPWEVENSQLVIRTPSVSGKTAAKQAVAWSETVSEYDPVWNVWNNISSGDYQIISNGAVMKDADGEALIGAGTYEMIVGQLNQINQDNIPDEDIRYIVNVARGAIGFYGNLQMKMSYAEEDRGGIRVKGNIGYVWGAGRYTDPETQEETDIDAYRFTVNEQWRNGEVFLTMWPAEGMDAFKATYPDLTVAIYEGAYLNVDALNAAGSKATDITSKVWGQELDMQPSKVRYKTNLVADTTEGAPYFTMVWFRDGVAAQVMPFQVLVHVEQDPAVLVRPGAGEYEDTTPTDFSELGVPHTNYVAAIKDEDGNDREYWEFPSRLNADGEEINEAFFERNNLTPETVYDDVDMFYYRVPEDDGFNGVGLDRFYVSALGYTHHVKAGELDKNGQEIKTPLTESKVAMTTFSSGTRIRTAYAGIEFYETKEAADKAVENEEARAITINSVKRDDGGWDYTFRGYREEECVSFFNAQGELVGRYIFDSDTEKNYDIAVYAGSKPYANLDEAKADTTAENVTAQIFTATGYGAEYSKTVYFSFFNSSGERFNCYGVHIQSVVRVNYGWMILNGDTRGLFNPTRRLTIDRDEETGRVTTTYTYTMQDEGYPEDGLYSVRVHYQRDFKELDPTAEDFAIIVSEADLSALTFAEARAQGKDVTAVAIKDPGYTTNYSNGVHFHVYNPAGELIDHSIVIARPYQAPAKSQDTYFHITGANDKNGNPYPGFAMPYTADAYYIHGYQTVFLMDTKKNEDGTLATDDDGNLIYIPIEDDTDFYPTFVSIRDRTTVYGMLDEGGEIQRSGENRYTFHNADPAQVLNYSAAAENGRHLKNYWVTFLTQQTGKAQLFVNTANDPSHYQQGRQDANGNPIIEREVFINDATGDHDIFFANIGDIRLENIKVTLSDESAIRLDDYWKLPLNGESVNRYLEPYGTVETRDVNGEWVNYGGIPNIAKIRVFAVNPEEAKSISADLTISGTYTTKDGVRKSVSQTIHLSGMVGDVKIDSPEEGALRDAVKWVPYANLIHTNNIYGGSTVSFAVTSGQLPSGMELRPNGEIYGAPKEIGAFTFTVTATFNYGDVTSTDSKTYTLNVLTNEGEQGDKNVWSENDWNKENDKQYFGVEHWIPDMTITGTEAAFNHSGPYESPASAGGDVETASETDERRSRNADKVTPQEWTEYHDVVFSTKNYSEDNQNGKADFDWFIDLWFNGERLRGVRLEKGQTFTDEMRSVYDFYYWRGSVWATVTGETIESKAIKDGNSNNTVSGEFRHGQNTNNKQYTSAANVKVKGPGKTVTPVNPKPVNPTPVNPKPVNPVVGGGGGGGGGGSSSGGGGATYYAITPASVSHGSISLSAESAASGTSITVTVKPDNGYKVKSVSATGSNGKSVTVTDDGNNKYTFKMPSRRVTVSAEFEASSFAIVTGTAPNGTITLDSESAAPGEAVNGSVTPDKGYLLSGVTVRDADGDTVKSETFDDGKFTFLMPSSKVTVSATFEVKRLASFKDIKGTDWFFDDAEWAYNRNILRGTTDEYWEPQSLMSSVTSIVTLERLDGVDLTPFDTGADDGIDNTKWYASAQRWARDNNILLKDRPFGERDAMTRGECAVMFVNYLRYRGMNVTPTSETEFTDADQMTQDELNAFRLLEEAGVFRGYSDGSIRPNNYLSRAHLAAVLHRLSEYIIKAETKAAESENP